MNTRRLVWLCNSPSPYNHFLFSFLAKTLPFPLTVVYLEIAGTEHAAVMQDSSYHWRKATSKFFDYELLVAALDPETSLVVGGWHVPLYYLVFLASRGRYLIWNDTPDLRKRRLALKEWIRRYLVQAAFAGAKWVMGTGTPAINTFKEMGAPISKLVTFPYWVELPILIAPPPRNATFTILAIGRLVAIKSFEHLIELARFLEVRGVRDYEIQLIGDGPERLRLNAMIAANGLEGRVKLVGWLDNQAVLTAIEACDVFVHTASWEPYGVVVLEAMARGKVVVASDQTMAAVDRIVQGHNGYLFPYGDIDRLATIIENLMQDPGHHDALGRRAFETSSQWSVARATETLVKLL